MTKHIRVVGAVILRDGVVLCAQRGIEGHLAGLWEFPGGKIEAGESGPEALKREIREELSCEIRVGRPVVTTTHDYGSSTVTLTTFYCELISGVPTLSEHHDMVWLSPEKLNSLEWAPADLPAVRAIEGAKLPVV